MKNMLALLLHSSLCTVEVNTNREQQLVCVAKVVVRDAVVDGGHVGGRGIARLDL